MKKVLLASFCLLINCSNFYYIKTVPTPKKSLYKIAIITENWDLYWVSSFAYRSLITELMDVGFCVIERSNLQSVLEEKKLKDSGVTGKDKQVFDDEIKINMTNILDKHKIQEYGELLGVNYLLMIYVVPSDRKLHMGTIRVVDVKTGIVLTSTTFVVPLTGRDADVMMKQIANDIYNVFKTSKKIITNKLDTGGDNTLRKDGDEILAK